jgi:hypothetical protein
MNTISALIALSLIGLTIVFQVCLVAGLPWAQASWGGKYQGVLPREMRWASASAIVLLLLFAAIIGSRAGLFLPSWRPFANYAIWFVIGYTFLGCMANTASPSKIERAIWLPVSSLLLLTQCIIVFLPA